MKGENENPEHHLLIRLLGKFELLGVFFIILLNSVGYTIILLFVMYLFETIGLSFLFKDFFLVKMINIKIGIHYKYLLSICFSALAAFFAISVILYAKLHQERSNKKEGEDLKGKTKSKGIDPLKVSYALGLIILIGYVKGYPFEGVDVYGNSVVRNYTFWVDFSLHVLSGFLLSFFSTYVNYIIAEEIKNILKSNVLITKIYQKYNNYITDSISEDAPAKKQKANPNTQGNTVFRKIPKAS